MLFKRGKAISGAPSIIGTNQFPKPPISVGITKKNHNKSMRSNYNVIKMMITPKEVLAWAT